jgi:endonuclease/exonuclease/phosphatase family metal-dependent hydrolase
MTLTTSTKPGPTPESATARSSDGQLRLVTLNIHKGLSHFNRRTVIHELRDGLRALDSDIVFLQEVQGEHERHALRLPGWPRVPQHEFLAEDRWLQHAYGRNAVYTHGHHGNAILSRFHIVSFENEDVSDHRLERRGLLHCVVSVPGWSRNLHCVCVHLSLHDRGRRRQLDALVRRLEPLAAKDAPIIIAGDFNDWRHRASAVLESRLGMTEASTSRSGRVARTFPSFLPMLRLDHGGAPWSLLSDHLAISAEVRRTAIRHL